MRTFDNPNEINDRFPYRFNRTLYLNGFEIFKDLDAVHVSQMVDKIQVIKAFSGTEIKTERIKGRHQLMIVESGKVELKGPDKVLTLRQDDFTGEFFLDHHKLQEFTLTAVEDSVVYFLDLSDFLLVLTNFRDKAKEVLEKIEENDLVKT
jgi:signal-transduction protein with cAMP-binding, CBS, and nucleotidyltransferase domain